MHQVVTLHGNRLTLERTGESSFVSTSPNPPMVLTDIMVTRHDGESVGASIPTFLFDQGPAIWVPAVMEQEQVIALAKGEPSGDRS
jgi:hypothetical protein